MEAGFAPQAGHEEKEEAPVKKLLALPSIIVHLKLWHTCNVSPFLVFTVDEFSAEIHDKKYFSSSINVSLVSFKCCILIGLQNLVEDGCGFFQRI